MSYHLSPRSMTRRGANFSGHAVHSGLVKPEMLVVLLGGCFRKAVGYGLEFRSE